MSSPQDHRSRRRHQVLTPIFFMVTQDAKVLEDAEHHIEGEVVDLSEEGFRMRSSHALEIGEEISFDISNQEKVIFRGVAKVMHGSVDQVYGMQYIKVRKG